MPDPLSLPRTQDSAGGHLIKSADVALKLGVSTAQLCRWRKAGTGPTWINLAGIPRYRAEDIDSYIEAQAVRS